MDVSAWLRGLRRPSSPPESSSFAGWRSAARRHASPDNPEPFSRPAAPLGSAGIAVRRVAAALLLAPLLLLTTEAAARTITGDSGNTITISPSSPVIEEGQTITYTVTGATLTGPGTVSTAIRSPIGQPGVADLAHDYTVTTGGTALTRSASFKNLSFSGNSVSFTITALSDTVAEGDEALTMVIDTDGVFEQFAIPFTIKNVAPPVQLDATVSFEETSITTNEGGPAGELTIVLSNPRPVVTYVPVKATGTGMHPAGAADHGVHPLARFVIPAGETRKTFPLWPNNDLLLEEDETYELSIDTARLAGFNRGVTAAGNTSVDVTVIDDEFTITFDKATYLFQEDVAGGHAEVTGELRGPTGIRTVGRDRVIRFRYDDLFTTRHRDYIRVPSVVVRAGESTFNLRIPIIDDHVFETNELFRVYRLYRREVDQFGTVTDILAPGQSLLQFADVIINDDERRRGYVERDFDDGYFFCEGPYFPADPDTNYPGGQRPPYLIDEDGDGVGDGPYDEVELPGGHPIAPAPIGGFGVSFDKEDYRAGDTATMTIRTWTGDRVCSTVGFEVRISSSHEPVSATIPWRRFAKLARGDSETSISFPLEAEGTVSFRMHRISARKVDAFGNPAEFPLFVVQGDTATRHDGPDYPAIEVTVGPKTGNAEIATPPVLTLAADAAQATEGDTVSFTITADPAPQQDVEVFLGAEERMGEGDDTVGVGRVEPVLLKAGETSVTWSFTAHSDEVERADGTIEARIDPDPNAQVYESYRVGDPSTATMALIDDDGTQAPPQPVTVSLAAEQSSIAEANGETKWTIALSRALAAGETVTVPYAVSGGDPGAHWSVVFRAADNGAGVTRHGHGKNGSELRFTEGGQTATMVLIGRPTTDTVARTIKVAFGTGGRAPSSTGIAAGIALGASSFEVAIIDDDGTQQPPPVVEPAVSIAAGTSPITEGGDAVFTLTATPAPSAPLAVTVAVVANGDYGITAGSRTVTIPTGGSATLTLPTTDDTADEPDGSATVTVQDGNGYTVGSPASGSVVIRDDDLPPPVISIAAKVASITEGGDAVFTIAADRAPDADLPVSIAVSESGDHVAAAHEGARTATIRQGATSAEITVPTVNDTVDEPDGTVTATLKGGSGYTPGSASSASVKVVDDDASSLPMLSIDDTTVGEGAMAQVTIRLSAPSKVPVRVHVGARESSPVSARAGEDFMAYTYRGWNAAVFRPGQTVKVHGFFVYDDSHDDGGETFEVFLSDAEGAQIADGVGIVTIRNDDPLPAAWLKRFGRTVAQQTLDGIAARIEAPRVAGMQGTLAGQAVNFGPGAGEAQQAASGIPAAGGDAALAMAGIARSFGADASAPAGSGGAGPFGNTDPFGNGGAGFGAPPGQSLAMQSRTMTARDALLGSSFSLTGERDGMGGSLAFWGRASQGRFDGTERGDGTDISLDGTVTTGMLGMDYARDRWLVGLALAQSSAKGDYAALGGSGCPEVGGEVPPLCDGGVRAGDGSIEASLTAAIPYAALQASERLKLWGAAGYGSGEVTVKTAPGGRYSADTSWTMAAAGLRSDLLDAPVDGGGGPALAVTSDALWARTSSEKTRDLAASDSDVTRLRLGLEGSWRIAMEGGGTPGSGSGASLVPKLEVGARHDGGDAETGFGVELGGGIAWTDPALGLSLDLSGRTLLAHEDDDFEDRGYSASLAFDPNPATGRGPSLSLRQDWGGRATGGLDALFAPDPLAERTGGGAAPASRWAMEAAYGFPAFGGRFTGSPHVGLGLATGARDYSLGWRLAPEAATAPDLSFGLRATRRESDTAQPEHTVGFELRARW